MSVTETQTSIIPMEKIIDNTSTICLLSIPVSHITAIFIQMYNFNNTQISGLKPPEDIIYILKLFLVILF